VYLNDTITELPDKLFYCADDYKNPMAIFAIYCNETKLGEIGTNTTITRIGK
jgi:hypothetical protein